MEGMNFGYSSGVTDPLTNVFIVQEITVELNLSSDINPRDIQVALTLCCDTLNSTLQSIHQFRINYMSDDGSSDDDDEGGQCDKPFGVTQGLCGEAKKDHPGCLQCCCCLPYACEHLL